MYVIGLDVGTTCTKALLVDDNGKIAGEGSSGYPLISSGKKIEQNPQDWIDASVLAIHQAVRTADVSQIKGISLSTQGASTAAVDGNGKFIGNAVTWMDTRSEK